MGVARRAVPLLALAWAVALASPAPTAAFGGFGKLTADATYGSAMHFRVELPSGAPERLELLLRFTGSDDTFVARVAPGAGSAEYTWDAVAHPLTPNTGIAYRWRATQAGVVSLSGEQNLLYDDDRSGLDWHTARIGDATVHWYGGAAAEAQHFGKVTADGAAAAEKLLGHTLAGPVDIFVYASRDDFFGALGPGAREWTGAATFPELRTIFMWLGGGSATYLETTMTHEVTHVVFHDATANPFHQPANWFNEGLATWAEKQSAANHADDVRAAAGNGSLLAFDAISESFPIGDAAARLAYDEGATMVQMIVDRYGRGAIAAIAAAWRDGAGDAEALQAGTGISAAQLYEAYFASFGASSPTAVKPTSMLASNVRKPSQPTSSGEGQPAATSGPVDQPAGGGAELDWLAWILIAGLGAGVALAVAVARRRPPDAA